MSTNPQAITASIKITTEIAQARLRENWAAKNLEFKKPYSGPEGNFPGLIKFGTPRIQIIEAVPSISSMNIAPADVIETRQFMKFQLIFKTEAALAKFENYVATLPKASSEPDTAITSTATPAVVVVSPIAPSAATSSATATTVSTTAIGTASTTAATSVPTTATTAASAANTSNSTTAESFASKSLPPSTSEQANITKAMFGLQQHMANSLLGNFQGLFPKPNQLLSAELPNPLLTAFSNMQLSAGMPTNATALPNAATLMNTVSNTISSAFASSTAASTMGSTATATSTTTSAAVSTQVKP
jgi:hypothetical protein